MTHSAPVDPGTSERDPRLISLVVPCYNEEEAFPHLRHELCTLADQLRDRFDVELILINDGSRDSTWECIRSFAAQDRRVRGICLSRNFGHQLALTSGYDLARGDAVVCLDADLQDPPEVVLEMVAKWQQGADVVYAIRTQREGETRFKLWTASLFYRLISAISWVRIRSNTGDFRLLSRRALDALNQLREQHRFVRGMVGWLGFQSADVHYERKARIAGETKYPFRKMLRLALDATVSFSSLPLRLTYVFALGLSAIVLLYLLVSTVRVLFLGVEAVPGWASLILCVSMFGGINLICMGIMGEYVGRIYEQSKGRPLYLIQELVGGAPPASPPKVEPTIVLIPARPQLHSGMARDENARSSSRPDPHDPARTEAP